MKIALHEMGTATHARQLAVALAAREHEVIYLYCPSVRSPSRGSLGFAPADKVTVVPVELGSEFAKTRLWRRFRQERAYGAEVASILDRLRADVIVSGNTHIEIQAAIQKMCGRSNTPFVLWLEDVYSIGIKAVLSKMPVLGHLISARYALLERRVARACDGVVAICEDFRDLVAAWGVDPRRIVVIENWGETPPDPAPTSDNDWAARHRLSDKRVFLYAGTLGFKHNPQLFLDLAAEFRGDPDIRIVVISEGDGALRLSRQGREFPGLLVLPFQSAEDFHKALACADVLLAILEPDAARYSVPSKVLTYMSAGKPILAAISAENLAARTVLAAGAGIVADPTDAGELRRLARDLIEDAAERNRLGAAALAYARRNFAIDVIAERFEDGIRRFATRGSGEAPPTAGAAKTVVVAT